MKTNRTSIISTFIWVVAAAMLTGGQLFAATRTWVISPSDNLWSTAANWGGTGPVANADLVAFNDSAITNLNNDLGVNFALTGITFNATTNSSYVVTNNAITLNGNITDNSPQVQALNTSLLLTNGTKTVAIIPGGNLIIGGVIGNYPLAGQNNGLTLSQNFAAPNQFVASSVQFNYPATATLTLNGTTANTYTNTTTLNAGTTLILDYSNMGTPVNLLSTNAVVMNGATYSIKGKASGSTFQTNNGNGAITFGTGGSQVVLNPNGGAGTTLKLGSSWTRNAPATVNVDVSAGGTLLSTPATVNGVLGYGVITDSTGIGFITTNLTTGALVRYTSATALDAAANSLVTNYVTSGNLTMAGSSFSVNSLTLDASSGAGILNLGGASVVMTNNSRGILMIGANNYTIQNGMIATNNGEVIIHQMGAGTLNLNAQIGTGTASFTKNGSGTMLINSVSTNSGTDVINRGTVKLGVASTTGAGPLGNTTNGLTINAGGSLDLNGNNLTVGTYSANGIGYVTNSASGTPAVFSIGNGNNRISGYANTFFAGNLALNIIGNNGTRDDLGNIANRHTGGTIYQGNNLSDRVVNAASFGSGPVTFNGSGGFTIPSSGLTGWTSGFTNAIVVNGIGNVWNFQNNGSFVRSEGPWTGAGTLTINNGFSPNFIWAGDISAFAGNLILQGSAGQTVRYTFSNVDSNGLAGSTNAVFTLQALTTGNVNFQYDQTNTVATIRLGDLNTTGNTGTGIIVARNNTVGTAVTFEVGALNASSTFGGSIQDFNGAVSVTKVGSGIWTLNGTGNGGNTYSGTTTISNGLLRVDSNLGGSGAVNVFGPGGLGGSGSVAGAVTLSSGNAGILLTNNSTGTLTLSGAGGLTLANGNVLAFDLGATSDQITLTGGTFTQSGTATIYLSQVSGFGAGTYTLITGASGISAANFVLGNTLSGYSLSLTNPDASTLALNVTVAAPAAAFWHNRSGTTWTTANNWDTDATGNIALATPPAIPTDVTFAANAASSFNTTLGADFSIHSLTLSTPNNVTIGGANTLTLSAGLVNDSAAGNNVLNTKIALGTDQTWANNSANSLIVNSNISGARALTIAAGSTSIVLNAANTYSGGTIINSGTLTLSNPTDTLANSGAVIVNGGNLDVGTVTDTVGAVALTNGAIVGVGGTLTASSYYAENGTLSANLAGSASFIKATGGTVMLSGTNSYTGATTVSGGTLQLGNSAALGNSSSLTVSGGSTLDLNGYNVSRPIAGISGGSTLLNDSINPSAITVDWANGNQSFTIAGSGNISLQAITGTATWTVTQNSSGTVTYGGTNDNSFMGLVVNNGTAVLAKPAGNSSHVVGGNISSGSDLVLNNGTVFVAPGGNGDQLFNNRFITVNAGLLDFNGQSEAVDGINGTGGVVTNSAATVATFTLGANNGSPGTFSGTIEGTLAVTKSGSGLQTLAGINTYTGNTTISAGTLALTEPGSIANSAIISIAGSSFLDVSGRADQTLTLTSGQTLTGAGTVNGNVTSVSGSVVNPGGINAVGTLRVTNNVSLGGKLVMELNRSASPNCDQLVSVGGTITYGGTLLVTNIGTALNVTNTFQLFPSAVTTFTAITLATNDASGNIYTWTNKVAIDGSIALLAVTPPVNLTPTNLVATVNGNQLILSWPADHTGWRLQAQTNALTVGLNTNWVTIPNTDTANSYTNTVDVSKPAVFYRMVYP